jgi:hypothetical protein
LSAVTLAHSQTAPDPLAAGFTEPPADARPLVYWQWVNGNVTAAGIRLDLEWMQRIGIAGALMFDIGFRTPPVPQYVEHRVGYGTAAWQQAVRVAAAESRRLGLQLGAQSSGGWSVSGGPMVAAEDAMKKLVWSETFVTPSSSLPVRLPPPPSNSGPFQDVPAGADHREPTKYVDVAVIAYRLPDAEQKATLHAAWSNVDDGSLLSDGRYDRSVELRPDPNGNIALTARLEGTSSARSFTLALQGAIPSGTIESSVDGIHYTSVVELPLRSAQRSPVVTFALGQRSERHWRVQFKDVKQPVRLAEARFDVAAYAHRFQEKAGYGVLADTAAAATEPVPEMSAVRPGDIVDLTGHMTAQGDLSWRPREGRWAVLRFGWSLTGKRVVPATPESTGLEVDKLDANAVRKFARDFYGRFRDASSATGQLQILLTDSWEAGQQNWTPEMFAEFERRRGYDLRRWLPVLTGRIVGDSTQTEKLLADFRRTIADLVADNHYGTLAEVAEEFGMQMYAEAAGTDLPTVVDGIQAKGRVDVPMGEYWIYPEGSAPKPNHVADIREAASASHLYGRRVVAAEALTTMGESAWAAGPAQLRHIVDRFFAEGVNRIVLHTSAHQPFTDRRPGLTLRQYGQHFTRNETWAEDASAWVEYLSRTSFLLQQGVPVADLAMYLGEGAPLSPRFDEPGEPRRLPGYDHDFINAEALLTRLTVRDGSLVTPNGTRYRALVLPETPMRMSLPVIRKLRELVQAGAMIVGPMPVGAEGLAATDKQVLDIADELWKQRRVYTRIEDALRTEKIAPDVATSKASLHWAHRSTPDTEIYFVSNQSGERLQEGVQFRVTGREVELWNAVDGSRSDASYTIGEQTTSVLLTLEPYSSHFVVFRGKAESLKHDAAIARRTTLKSFNEDWTVAFMDGLGAPAQTQFPALRSWTEESNPAVRYYSGRAAYERTIDIPRKWLSQHRRIELDLGTVGEMARISVNGTDLGVVWNAPFKRDITNALRPGRNHLRIVVTNYWMNRLIGDQQPGATPVTFAPIKPYGADAPLRPSGLLGPVRLIGLN